MTSIFYREANAGVQNARGCWEACQGFRAFFTFNLFADDFPSCTRACCERSLFVAHLFYISLKAHERVPAPARWLALRLLEAKPRSVTVTPLQSRWLIVVRLRAPGELNLNAVSSASPPNDSIVCWACRTLNCSRPSSPSYLDSLKLAPLACDFG